MTKGMIGFILLVFIPLSQATAISEPNTSSDELSLFFDDEQLVSIATKHLQKINKAPAIVSIVTSQDIENMGARNLQDVLQRVPGFASTISVYGLNEITVRGVKRLDSPNVKVLIDGHAVNEDFSGGTGWTFGRLSLDNIKRIEIIRGPGSALYGANAFAGVINVVTKEASDIAGLTLTAGHGSNATTHANAQFGRHFGDLAIASHIDLYDSTGPKLYVASDLYGQAGYTVFDQRRVDTSLKISYQNFSLHARYIESKRGPYIGLASALDPESHVEASQYFVNFGYQRQISDAVKLSAKVYMDQMAWRTNIQFLPPSLYPAPEGMISTPESKFGGPGTEITLDYQWATTNLLTTGLVVENHKVTEVATHANYDSNATSPTYLSPLGSIQDVSNGGNWLDVPNAKRRIWALYAQNVWQASDAVGITLGLRHDHYSDFGATTNPRAAVVWQFAPTWDAKILYATAFGAPTFSELYLINNPAYAGNPDLKPENMKTFEMTIGRTYHRHTKGRLTYFRNRYQDKVAYVPFASGYLTVNSGGANIQGVEGEIQHRLSSGSELYVNITQLEAKNSVTDETLPDVADGMVNIGANITLIPHINVNANLRASRETPRVAGDPRPAVPGYGVMDMAVIIKEIVKGLHMRAAVHNVLDKEYVDAAPLGGVNSDHPRSGRTYMIDIGYKL